MNKKIEQQINQIYANIYKQVFTEERLKKLRTGSRADIIATLNMLQGSAKYKEFANKFAIELAKKGLSTQKGVWRKYYEAARKAHYISLPQTYNQFELQALSKAVKHNFEMITSIPERMMEVLNHKYTSTLIEEVAKGTLSKGSFRQLLASHGQKQAKLIARTETAKLRTAITEYRATELGSVAYIWKSSNDTRTRPSHKAMNGVIVFWRDQSQKPLLDGMRGNAGEFPNCRCDAQPIVDIDYLKASRYKVYNYKTDQIITMTKTELLDALNRGEL